MPPLRVVSKRIARELFRRGFTLRGGIFSALYLVAFALAVLVLTTMVIPWYIMMFRSHFAGLPPEILESARIDGATGWQQIWHIKIPLMMPVLIVTLLYGVIGFIDDYKKLVLRDPAGLAARYKYFWQSVAGLGAAATAPQRGQRPTCPGDIVGSSSSRSLMDASHWLRSQSSPPSSFMYAASSRARAISPRLNCRSA